ncbi:protein kinase domain-containing protein [Leptolyngbya ohadii]|uniref:protein kinase domain-containing protein n=1 Tax=Leptolyngbya ohadii TaxID=1962290 RepID=UPI0015C58660|nr:hypothetical protein [Leptolyngbya ohadii]
MKTDRKIELRKQLKKSGEASIWETNISNLVAKIYHSMMPEQIEKLNTMVANKPDISTLSSKHISIAWPDEILVDEEERCVGFLMPYVDGKTLVNVYNPIKREKEARGVNWRYLYGVAANTALIVKALHAKQYVVGDIKPENFLVNSEALVSVIDTDSFQIPKLTEGELLEVYRCPVGSKEFTPPELIGASFIDSIRLQAHDNFGLAVIIYHLLLGGKHPFSGRWTGEGADPSIDDLIHQGSWLYAPNSKLQVTSGTIPLEILHPKVQEYFHQCFTQGHSNPNARPGAEAWFRVLKEAYEDLADCGAEINHQYSKHYGRCYWCEMRQKLGGHDIFVPLGPKFTPSKEIHFPAPKKNSIPVKALIGAGVALTSAAGLIVTLNLSSFQTAETLQLPTLPCRNEPLPPSDFEDNRLALNEDLNRPPASGRGSTNLYNSTGLYVARYDGEFLNSERNGCGTLTFASGTRYVGEFRNDKFSGLGELTWKNGDRYVGEFENGKCHGRGTYIFADKTFTSGEWRYGDKVGSNLTCNYGG